MLAASRNISACKAQAVSQVGCRLMVASSAKISRPRLPAVAAGPSERTRSIKAAISGREEGGAGGCWGGGGGGRGGRTGSKRAAFPGGEEAGAGVCWDLSLLMGAVYTDSKRAA